MTHPRKPRNRTRTPKATPGLAPRRIAADAVDGVLFRGRPFDATLESEESAAIMGAMEPRDRALTTMICQTTLRQLGLLRAVLARKLQKPLPPRSGRTQAIILVAMAQILFLDIPAHAAVDMAVRDAMRDRNARHFKALVNAVLRALAADPEAAIAGLDPRSCNTPEWLVRRWRAAFGEDAAAAILGAHALVPPVDLTVKSDARAWADRLGGTAIAPTTVRISRTGRIDELPGYREGQWWVQDYAASLPARLLGDVAGKDVADLAAAPGGKTAQLALAGARVTAVDRSAQRLERLGENMQRLHLEAHTVAADIAGWAPGRTFDAILLDAPCSATGTIRRHPDIPWLRKPDDFAAMGKVQAALVHKAAELLRPGGTLVYSTCSLEREEGEDVIEAVLGAGAPLKPGPATAGELGVPPEAITDRGFLRTRPDMAAPGPQGEGHAGMDGFFAARLTRT